MIARKLTETIQKYLSYGKVIIIYGARQVGKTTLIQEYLKSKKDVLQLNCDNPPTVSSLTNASLAELKMIVGNHKFVFIDEAQRVKNIGLTLKLIYDNIPDVQLIVSGSSSFDLANEINEPLTGRKFELMLTPLSIGEIYESEGYIEVKSKLNHHIIFGMYPDIITNPQAAETNLLNLSSSYLYKDIFEWQRIRKPEVIQKLLKALALQIGSEISYNELSRLLGVSKDTIASYIQLLEQAFVIYRLPSFSRNLRTELRHKSKVYFWDTGVRNALINNFNPIEDRPDKGALWENFVINEIRKKNLNQDQNSNYYFWRTVRQQEVDLIMEINQKLSAFEIKWNLSKSAKIPKPFKDNYPNAETHIIRPDRFLEFILADI